MKEYKEMYLYLFNSVTTAIEYLEEINYMYALEILVKAQQQCEELYINAEDAKAPVSSPAGGS